MHKTASIAVSLNINKRKSKILKNNSININRTTLDSKALEEMEVLTYLSDIIHKQGRSNAHMEVRNFKAMAAFPQLKNTWNSKITLSQH